MGARVRRSIGGAQLRNLDPFLMLDEFSVRKPGTTYLTIAFFARLSVLYVPVLKCT